MKVMLITTDAFGAPGGIAQYNRDLLIALTAMPDVEEVVTVPRSPYSPDQALPAKLQYLPPAVNSKLSFLRQVFGASKRHFDLIVCGHLNLLPVAALLELRTKASAL